MARAAKRGQVALLVITASCQFYHMVHFKPSSLPALLAPVPVPLQNQLPGFSPGPGRGVNLPAGHLNHHGQGYPILFIRPLASARYSRFRSIPTEPLEVPGPRPACTTASKWAALPEYRVSVAAAGGLPAEGLGLGLSIYSSSPALTLPSPTLQSCQDLPVFPAPPLTHGAPQSASPRPARWCPQGCNAGAVPGKVAKCRRAMPCVGHRPDVARVAAIGQDDLQIRFRKSSVALAEPPCLFRLSL